MTKFRVFDKIYNQIVPVVEINFLEKKVGIEVVKGEGSKWRNFDEVELMRFIGLKDRDGVEIYEGDIIDVYDTERGCFHHDWEDCDAPSDAECKDHGPHRHEKKGDCDDFLCTQVVKESEATGFFCDEDTGDFCPALGSDEIEIKVISNIHEAPELLEKK